MLKLVAVNTEPWHAAPRHGSSCATNPAIIVMPRSRCCDVGFHGVGFIMFIFPWTANRPKSAYYLDTFRSSAHGGSEAPGELHEAAGGGDWSF